MYANKRAHTFNIYTQKMRKREKEKRKCRISQQCYKLAYKVENPFIILEWTLVYCYNSWDAMINRIDGQQHWSCEVNPILKRAMRQIEYFQGIACLFLRVFYMVEKCLLTCKKQSEITEESNQIFKIEVIW